MIIKEESAVARGAVAAGSCELILTNLNLVVVKKGFFGGDKETRVFPISDIKVHNGQAQALMGKNGRGTPSLEVYFLSGQASFDFRTGGKSKVLTWMTKINQVRTGKDVSAGHEASRALPGADAVAGVLKDTIGAFTSKFGSRAADPVATAAKCSGCGAPISGTRGQVSTCPYCGTAQQL